MQKTFWQRINPWAKVRKYEGASKSKRMRNWKTDSTSANSALYGSLEILRNRSRDLKRNNPFASRGLHAIATNTVGKGIRTQFRDKNSTSPSNPAEEMWKPWAESKTFDFDGRYDIFGFQRMIMQATPESGEILIRKRINKKLPFPLQYQILESDFLDTDKTQFKTDNGNTIIQGIEFDQDGKRVAYWLFEQHPGAFYEQYGLKKLTSQRVLASEIRHIFRQERPGQARGVPWLAPVMVRLKDLDDYEDAQLMRQKIAACFTAFVQDISADVMDASEGGTKENPELSERVEPGLIEFLPTGKTVTFSAPPEVANYDQFTKNVLRSVAAGLGVSYEVLTGDLSEVNFSSARLGWIEFMRNLEVWRKELVIDGFLCGVVEDFIEVAKILGKDFSQMTPVHTPPRREMIDPTKEIAAAEASIKAGLSTWSEELMALGKDPEEHFAQYAKDKKMIDQYGLKLTSDASIAQASKQNQGSDNNENQNTQN